MKAFKREEVVERNTRRSKSLTSVNLAIKLCVQLKRFDRVKRILLFKIRVFTEGLVYSYEGRKIRSGLGEKSVD